MNRTKVMLAVALGLFAVGAAGWAFRDEISDAWGNIWERQDETHLDKGVVVYLFHTSEHCDPCDEVTAWTRDAMAVRFAAEINDGRLVWKEVDIDAKSNRRFADKFQLGGLKLAVVLVTFKDSRQAGYKNLLGVWDHLDDKGAYMQYIRAEIAAALGEVS